MDDPLDWLDLQHLLRKPWQHFFCSRSAVSIREAIKVGAGGEENSIDAAVRSFVRGGCASWPPLSERDAALIGARLHWAFFLVTSAIESASPPFAPTGEDEEQALEFLLIDAWRQGGRVCFGLLLKD